MKAGLGSSTSFAVCLAACFVHWKCLQRGNAHYQFNEEELKRISNYANRCEEVVQLYMPEMDARVCTYGQICRYRYNIKRRNKDILLKVPKMKILLIDSGIRLNKYQQLEIMAQKRYSHPTNVDNILVRINQISKTAIRNLAALYKFITKRNVFLHKLQEIHEILSINIQLNQKWLCELGLSHPNLNKICTIAKTNKLPGKLTGFGGYAYILLPPDVSLEFVAFISEQILEAGFTVTMTTVSCNGVRIDY
ncbi:mevalonate kinase [Lasius niger]|uniref:Mevalonate kinase n=1 Tax=Lasius niger TaxID=67767 RepID=A0A0J7KB70_LASNI|nr:mevalonate kinase [Lasius niger]